MNVAEVDVEGYRIFAAALSAASGPGLVAAVVVSEIRTRDEGLREVFREEAIGGGYRWASVADALDCAIGQGKDVARRKGYRVSQPGQMG